VAFLDTHIFQTAADIDPVFSPLFAQAYGHCLGLLLGVPLLPTPAVTTTAAAAPTTAAAAATTAAAASAATGTPAAPVPAAEHPAADPAAAARHLLAVRATKLLHLVIPMLLSPDGALGRRQRYARFIKGDFQGLISLLVRFCKRKPLPGKPPGVELSDASRLKRAVTMSRRPGGIKKAASALTGAGMAERTLETLAALQAKHPEESADAINRATLAALRHVAAALPLPPAVVTAAAAAAAAVPAAAAAAASVPAAAAASPAASSSAPAAAGTTPLKPETILAVVQRASPQTSAGADGLRYRHLQQMLDPHVAGSGRLLDLLARFADRCFHTTAALPDEFFALFKGAVLHAEGEKKRPIACGGTLRRLVSSVYCVENRSDIAHLLEPAGQFGVAVSSGVERVAAAVRLNHEAGGWNLLLDGANAFNSISRAAALPALAEHVPEAVPFLAKIYGGAPAKLLYQLADGTVAVVPSRTGCQQGDPFGPLLYSVATLDLMVAFRERFDRHGISLLGIIDDLTIGCRPDMPLSDPAVAEAFYFVRDGLAALGVQLNLTKCAALPPRHHIGQPAPSYAGGSCGGGGSSRDGHGGGGDITGGSTGSSGGDAGRDNSNGGSGACAAIGGISGNGNGGSSTGGNTSICGGGGIGAGGTGSSGAGGGTPAAARSNGKGKARRQMVLPALGPGLSAAAAAAAAALGSTAAGAGAGARPAEPVSAEDLAALARLGVPLAPDGVVIVGVPLGSTAFIRAHLQRQLCDGAAGSLFRLLAEMESVQTAYAILRLSGVPRTVYAGRTVSPVAAAVEFARFDALVTWALATLMWRNDPLGDGVVLPTFTSFFADPDVSRLPYTAEQLQQLRLPIRHSGLGMLSAVGTSPAAFASSMSDALPRLLAHLPEPQVAAIRAQLPTLPLVRDILASIKVRSGGR
jgi:hypothetical protein